LRERIANGEDGARQSEIHSLLAIRPLRNQLKLRELKMTGAETLDVARDAIWTIVVVSSPLMVVGLVVGVVVSLFQALTQIQEQTLVFVPKILAIFVTLLLALPFMADALHSHMMRISSRIIGG
jgi:flagellar biosynthetic protein FliQ